LVDEAHTDSELDFLPVAYSKACRLLTTVLKCKEPEKTDTRGALLGSIDSEYAALFLRAVIEFDVYHWFSISDGLVKEAGLLNRK